jgi:hypothetical protein
MTNQIRTQFKLDYLRANVVERATPVKGVTIETTSDLYSDNTQIVGTTHELLALGDVTDDAFAVIENLHASAEVSVGGDDASVFVEWFSIPAGYPPAVIPKVAALASTYLKSTAADTPVRVSIYKVVAPA